MTKFSITMSDDLGGYVQGTMKERKNMVATTAVSGSSCRLKSQSGS